MRATHSVGLAGLLLLGLFAINPVRASAVPSASGGIYISQSDTIPAHYRYYRPYRRYYRPYGYYRPYRYYYRPYGYYRPYYYYYRPYGYYRPYPYYYGGSGVGVYFGF
jgi:hypothetical protein